MSTPLSEDQRRVLAQLVGDMAPRLLTYVRRVYARQDEAEDIVAETFARAATHYEKLRSSPRPDLFLLRIARNLCLDLLRRQRTITEHALQTPRRNADDAPADGLLQAEALRELGSAVESLPAAQREVLVLKFTAGLTFEEIAQTLEIPLGTALSRMHAAMARLRSTLRVVPS